MQQLTKNEALKLTLDKSEISEAIVQWLVHVGTLKAGEHKVQWTWYISDHDVHVDLTVTSEGK